MQSFDNSTRGLDSSTALDFARALRAFTDIGNKTTVATLYQAGEELYSQFDKVILLDKGHQAFFGSTSEARTYFEELGFTHVEGQTTAEFLVTVTDPNSRAAKPGSVAEGIKTPQDLAAAFKGSRHYKSILSDIEEYNLGQVGNSTPLPGDKFRLSYPAQVQECLRRELHLVLGQRRVYFVKWFTTVVLCLVCGSAYFDIDNTAQGAFTRGGILYFALIINGWLQFPELFDAHTNRPVVERQGEQGIFTQVSETTADETSPAPRHQAILGRAGEIPDRPAPDSLPARHFHHFVLLPCETAAGGWEVLLLLPDSFHIHRLLQQPAAHVRLICWHLR